MKRIERNRSRREGEQVELEKVSENGGYDNERKQISAASLTRLMMFGSKATSNTINTVQSLLSTPKRFWGDIGPLGANRTSANYPIVYLFLLMVFAFT